MTSLARVGISYYHLGEMWTGFKTEKEYLEITPQTQTYFGLTEAAQALTPSTDRLLIVGDSRSLYFPRDFYANSIFDRQLLVTLAQSEKDSDGIRRCLKELGVDDLAVSGEEGRRLAYQIENQREGHYFVVYFNLIPSAIEELWQEYHLNEDLIRFVTLRTDKVLEKIEFKVLEEQL